MKDNMNVKFSSQHSNRFTVHYTRHLGKGVLSITFRHSIQIAFSLASVRNSQRRMER